MKKHLLIPFLFCIGISAQGQLSCGTKIGQTYYDLASNASQPNRIVQNNDGSLSVVWIEHWDILNPDNTPRGNVRGFGYNHYDPSTGQWSYGTDGECWEDQFGCASSYTGWPQIINLENSNKEMVVSHTPLKITERNTIGSGNWSNTTNLNIEQDMGPGNWNGTWPRAVSSGNYIHLIGTSNELNGFIDSSGVEMPCIYLRSSDGGQTWDSPMSFLMDTMEVKSVGADAYAIHSNGDYVAVTFGSGIDNDWLLFKSTDNGTTWSKTTIKNNHGLDTAVIDQQGGWGVITNNRQFDVTIDDSGVVHCFASMGYMSDNGGQYIVSSDDYFLGGPGWNESLGILYWNDADTINPMVIATPDYDLDGDANGYNAHSEYYGHVFCGWPTSAYDADGNIYLVFSAIAEDQGADFISVNNDTLGYHDIYFMVSGDGGKTWGSSFMYSEFDEASCDSVFIIDSGTTNINQILCGGFGGSPTQDDVFPSVAKKVGNDGTLHLTWQGDYSRPGLALYDETHPNDVLNYIHYLAINLSFDQRPAGTGNGSKWRTSGTDCTGISDEYNGIQINIYPNPASDLITLQSDSQIEKVNIFNYQGQLVLVSNQFNKNISLDVSILNSGMYLIKVKTVKGITTQKVTIN